MRCTVLLALLLLTAVPACRDEPSFDERYDAAQKKISASAERIDRDLEAVPTEAGSSPPQEREDSGD